MYPTDMSGGRTSIRAVLLLTALLVVGGFSAPSSVAQNTFDGLVVEQANGRPIPGVHVFLLADGAGVISDTDGTFRLRRPPRPDTLVARFIGFEEVRVPVSPDQASRLTLRMSMKDIRLNDVVISATRERQFASDIAASIGSVDGRAIRDQNPSHPSEVMGQIAGVWVNHTTGEGHMTSIRQPLSTDPLYLYLENGVPTRSTGFFNHNALYEINIPQSNGIEVLKGPGTALYGSDAIGGVINVTSAAAPPDPMMEVMLEGGSFGYRRVLASGGTTSGLNGVRLDFNATASDGWRDATDYARQSATLRWDRRSNSDWVLRTVASFSRVDQGPAGSAALSEQDYLADASMNYQPVSYRKVTAVRVSSAFEKLGRQTMVSITPYARFNTMDLLPNWSLTFDPATWETQNLSVGALLKVRKDFPAFRSRVVSGLDLDLSPGERIETAVDPVREGKIFTAYTMADPLYDYYVTYSQVSPYVHVESSLVESVRLTAGLRFDRMAYDYTNNLGELTAGRHRRPVDATRSFSALSPKLGLTWQVHRSANLFAAWRSAFRAPSENQLFRQGGSSNSIDLDPVTAVNSELGIRGRLQRWGQYEVTAYQLIKKDDILDLVLDDGTIVSSNAGRTEHRGIEYGAASAAWHGLSLSVSGSYAEHRYEEWDAENGDDYSGNEMEVAPRSLLNAGATWKMGILEGAAFTVEWSRLGDYWMDPANSSKYNGHSLLNLHVRVHLTKDLTLLSRMSNVTDKLYAERATYNRFRGDEFAPGSPRSFHLSLRYRVR
ncbi:MAG: TonB-dependent receptor [Bacteroidota bacterium]|nr:TonB-dependent receptor [Bacteroidota bacterium]